MQTEDLHRAYAESPQAAAHFFEPITQRSSRYDALEDGHGPDADLGPYYDGSNEMRMCG